MKTYWIDTGIKQKKSGGLVVEAVGQLLEESNVDSMEKKRVLRRFALVYLAKGDGSFVSASCGKCHVQAGDLFLLLPGEWHHYGPKEGDEWTEYFVIFNGFIPQAYRENGVFNPAQPIVRTGQSAEIHTFFADAYEKAHSRPPGYVEAIQADLFLIMAKSFVSPHFPETAYDHLVNDIKRAFAACFQKSVNLREVLESTGYGYDYARRVFREQEGLSPNAYLTRLRMEEAKKLLVETDLSTSEIGYRTGFDDPSYFCRVFKKWVGLKATVFRIEYRQMGRAQPRPLT